MQQLHSSVSFGTEEHCRDATVRPRPASRHTILRDALLAICDGKWDQAERALAQDPRLARDDAACLNLCGIICQARGRWKQARRFYGKAMRRDRSYLPAEQNMRRFYELSTLGGTDFPVALVDRVTLTAIRNLVAAPTSSAERLSQLGALKSISRFTTDAATITRVKQPQDWRGMLLAVGTVALATAIGWPLVHSSLHLANVNILMLYLLSVIWVATHYSRGAAVLASVLGVATFDFVFVEPYYTFAVADEQYLVTFGVMLLTALVISTLTDRMRKQSELARQAWERVETEFLRNTLLSGVSHELRTPLAAIAGASSAIIGSDGKLDTATQDDLLKTISVESARMERLITNLLDMTRLESGGLVLKRDWHPLQEVIGSALNHLDNRLRGRDVRIEIPPDLPLVQIDALAIEQVLSNLIDNAVEHTPAGTPIEIRADAAGGGELMVDIADHGLGLPPGTERRVFEKFFRVHPPGSRGGVGLGLAIARGIVEAHGGAISATNRAEGGAVFRFTVPLAVAPPVLDTSA